MRIFDKKLYITDILDVRKGTIPISTPSCASRRSDAFVFILSGRADYTFDDRIMSAEAGDIMYLSHGSSYNISVTEPGYSFIFVDFLFSESHGGCIENDIFKGEKLASLENSFMKLHRNWTVGTFSEHIECMAVLYQIYAAIVGMRTGRYTPPSKKNIISSAVTKMVENYSDPKLSVEALSREIGISEVHFRRIFYEIYRTSPKKFIISRRIHKAKELLVTTALPIAKISEMCGFVNAYYFSKLFRESTGMTPTELRETFKFT